MVFNATFNNISAISWWKWLLYIRCLSQKMKEWGEKGRGEDFCLV
jgi:hypothetical protein